MKIANIVSTTELKVPEEFNVVKTVDEVIHGLPTLIIGWDYIDKNYPNYDITNRMINSNLFWTFKKTERRDQHEEDVQNFIIKTYKNLVKGIPYVFIDPIQFDNKKIYKVIKKIKTSQNVSFVYGDMVYIYCEKIIFGVDLKLLKYIGFNVDTVIKKIKLYSKVFLDNNTILIEYRKYIDALDNQVKYIPFLYSITYG